MTAECYLKDKQSDGVFSSDWRMVFSINGMVRPSFFKLTGEWNDNKM